MGVPSDIAVSRGDVVRRQEQLDGEIAATRTSRRGEHMSVGEGGIRVFGEGGVTIGGGGNLLVTEDGDIIIRGGNLRLQSVDDDSLVFFGNVIVGDDTSRGWIFRFHPDEDGNAPIAFSLAGGPGAQEWALNDRDGSRLVANDTLSGHGLARPWIPYHLLATENAEQSGTSLWASTTVGSPGTALLSALVPIQHPRIRIGAAVTTTGGGTGHWRLTIASSTTTTTLVSDETGFAIHDVEVPGWGDDITFGEEVLLSLEAWVTGGGTRAFVQYDRLYGKGS